MDPATEPSMRPLYPTDAVAAGRGGKRRALERALRHAIERGQALPGEPLPSSRELAAQHGVHRHTVLAALDALVAEGWLEVAPRRGFRVSRELPDEFRTAARPAPRAAVPRA